MKRRKYRYALIVLTALLVLCGPSKGAAARDWSGEIIYFILTDRFHDGDRANNQDVRKEEIARYHGGDLQGIIDRLDELAALGVTALWVSPCMKNQREFIDSDGYHGYWVLDFSRTDEHQGTLEKFREMVDGAHRRGLKVILDMPLNSVAWEHPFTKDPAKSGWFHRAGTITNWNDERECEEGSLFGLPDLAQENREVADYLIEVSKWWARQTRVDGFRLDAVKHIPKAFWTRYCRELHDEMGEGFFLIGEDFTGDPRHVGAYVKTGMDSLFDFPLYFAAVDVFARGAGMRKLGQCIAEGDRLYDNPPMMSLMLENHDVSRFVTEAGTHAREKLKVALAFLFTIHRIPTVYYGLEEGMAGRCSMTEGVWNRADMAWGKDPGLQRYFTALARLRRDTPALREGAFTELYVDDDVLAYARTLQGRAALAVLNSSGRSITREIAVPDGLPLCNGVLRAATGGDCATVKSGKIHIRLGAYGAGIFLAADDDAATGAR